MGVGRAVSFCFPAVYCQSFAWPGRCHLILFVRGAGLFFFIIPIWIKMQINTTEIRCRQGGAGEDGIQGVYRVSDNWLRDKEKGNVCSNLFVYIKTHNETKNITTKLKVIYRAFVSRTTHFMRQRTRKICSIFFVYKKTESEIKNLHTKFKDSHSKNNLYK